MKTPQVSPILKYMNSNGQWNEEGLKYLALLKSVIDDQQAKIDDFETRITALEP